MNPRIPVLSVCVPTYDRCEVLADLLATVMPQLHACEGQVELVISDNASTDGTPGLLESLRSEVDVRVHRHTANLGMAANIMFAAQQIARGKYVWVVGDDDLIPPGSLNRVLDLIATHPDVPFFFVNTHVAPAASRAEVSALIAEAGTSWLGTGIPGQRKGRLAGRVRMSSWAELVDPLIDDVFLGALMCGVCRADVWRKTSVTCEPSGPRFHALRHAYPHCLVYARGGLIGQPAVYEEAPCTIAFFGDQEWISTELRMLLLVWQQELLEEYARAGVPRSRVEYCRGVLLERSRGLLTATLLEPQNSQDRQRFSLRRFMWLNRHQGRTLFASLDQVARQLASASLPHPMYSALRTAKKRVAN